MSQPEFKPWKPTGHFLKRWGERFPDLNWKQEIESTRVAKSTLRKKINKLCPRVGVKPTVSNDKFYLVSPMRKIAFICSIEREIITVFSYAKEEKEQGNSKSVTV